MFGRLAVFSYLAIFPILSSALDDRRTFFDGKTLNIPVSDDHLIDLYQQWIDTALSSLFTAVANKRLNDRPIGMGAKRRFGECNEMADSVPRHAKCVSKLFKFRFLPSISDIRKSIHRPQRLHRYRFPQRHWIGSFKTSRRKRSLRLEHYKLHDTKRTITPLGSIAKLLIDDLLTKRNKTEIKNWKETVSRLKETADKREKLKNQIEEKNDIPIFMKNFQKTKKTEKKKRKPKEEKILSLVREGLRLGYRMAGANVTNFDNRNNKVLSPRFLGVVADDEDSEKNDFLSPSLFSLHSNGKGVEQLTSLPNLFSAFGLKDQELWLDYIMEASGVNDEAEKVEKSLSSEMRPKNVIEEYRKEAFMNDGTPLYFTKENFTEIYGQNESRKVETIEQLNGMFDFQQVGHFLRSLTVQMSEMNSTGYSFLTADQIDHLYGPNSPYGNTERHRLFKSLNRSEIHKHLEADIHSLSERKSFSIRQKDIVLSPILFSPVILEPQLLSQPAILSPILFTPAILSPAIFGPVILTPWLFVPVVLSPRIMSPLIISPFMFSPLILSPVALHPGILSPGLFNPAVLTPLLLSPLILSPLLFTPLILSPLCLSPLILTPLVGSPLILSPFVLSPSILSPATLGGIIMSPYALSPVFLSPVSAFVVLLSPSWLS